MLYRGSLRALADYLLVVPAILIALGPPQLALVLGDPVPVTYHVSGDGDDSGDGSEASPWRTISHAVANSDPTDTIQVGSGSYDSEAGEHFPIAVDDGAHNFQGPGDGSAVISTGGEDGLRSFGFIAGEFVVNGLSFEGGLSSEGGSTYQGDLIELRGAEQLTITNNTFTAFDDAVYVRTDISPSSAPHVDTLHVISGNTFAAGNDAVQDWYTVSSTSGELARELVITGNTFSGLDSDALDLEIGAYYSSSAQLDAALTISGNTFLDAGDGVQIDAFASYGFVLNINNEIVGNDFQGGGVAISISSSMDTSVVWNADTLLEGNNISGASVGISLAYYASYDSNQAEVDWTIVDNEVIDGGEGVYLYVSVYSPYDTLGHDVLISGNEISGNSSTGINASVTVTSYTGISYDGDWDITNNTVSGNEYGIFLYGDSDGTLESVDYDFELRGNTVTDNQYNGIWLEFDYSSGTAGVHYEIDLDMGTETLFGYNTLQGNGGNAGSAFLSADLLASGYSSQGVTLNAVGNWWGTTDLLAIEDQVWHQPDSPGPLGGPHLSMPVDFSSPLPDELAFTGSADASGAVSLEAVALSGFVSHAGNTNIQVTVDGVAAAGVVVSGDHRTLSFEAPGLTGERLVCVTNPGGQSGCASVDFGGGDCLNNNLPTAVYDSAEVAGGESVDIDLLANDQDTDGELDPGSVVLVQLPLHGTVEDLGSGVVRYTPPAGWGQNTETFNYTVADNCAGVSNIATVAVQVSDGGAGAENHLPTAVFDAATTSPGDRVVVNLLANDYDFDGDALVAAEIVSSPSKGFVRLNGDLSLSYMPYPHVAGTTDTLTYTVTDSQGGVSNQATVELTIEAYTGPPSGGKGRPPGGGGGGGGNKSPSSSPLLPGAAIGGAVGRNSASQGSSPQAPPGSGG